MMYYVTSMNGDNSLVVKKLLKLPTVVLPFSSLLKTLLPVRLLSPTPATRDRKQQQLCIIMSQHTLVVFHPSSHLH
jgi:hypothetical protein